MADVFDFYVRDNRKITFDIAEPIMREDSGVTDFRFHIPKTINGLDMSDWAWWFVFVNAKKEKYSIALELSDDPERPLEFNLATYTVDYAMSIKAGAVQFALEAINTGTGGAIDNEWHTLTYETKVKDTLQGNQAEYAETESDIISELLIEVRNKVNQLVGGATPLPVNLKSLMTDPQKVYLYTGTEQGEYTGNWYYHNGTQFVHGGVYGAGVDAERLNRIAFGCYVVEESTGPIAHFEDGADNIPMKDVLIHIEPVQAGSGDPSPDNVRAITGWTKAMVTRAGKNLFDVQNLGTLNVGSTFSVDGNRITVTVDGQSRYQGVRYGSTSSLIFLPGTYHIKANILSLSDSTFNRLAFRNNASLIKSPISITTTGEISTTVTINEPCYFSILANGSTALPNEIVIEDLIISNTDSTYEPYSGSTYSITFPSSAGTVYGGTLDVTSGVLTVTHKLYTFDGSENWTAGNYGNRYEFNLTGLPDYIKTWNSGGRGLSNLGIYDNTAYSTPDKNYATSRTSVGTSATGAKSHVLVMPPSVATTVEELKAFLANTPEQWYAPLQTPQTYQLTPQEITSLLGTNNVWADTGDSEVEYRADTKMYVDAKVAAAVSALS